jgi:multicomponent Na+:H+ antiporter subunit G
MELIASILLVAGGGLTLLAAVGLIRFQDVFTRMHAATKPATLGLILILTGTALVLPRADPIAKLALVILLQFITAPVGAHLIGRAAFRSAEPVRADTEMDEPSRLLRDSPE